MKKTYWWRVLILMLTCLIFGFGYLTVNAYKLGICSKGSYCLLHYNNYIDPLMFFSLSFMVVSVFFFFIDDAIFIKWIRFALLWAVITLILVFIAPTYSGGFLGLGLTKEFVSISMGALLVVISFGLISSQFYQSKRK